MINFKLALNVMKDVQYAMGEIIINALHALKDIICINKKLFAQKLILVHFQHILTQIQIGANYVLLDASNVNQSQNVYVVQQIIICF